MAVLKRDYYEVLGVPRDADDDEIRRAFHTLARDWHPDVADSEDAELRFRELAEAYSVLSKPEARLLYDRYGYRGRGNLVFEEERLATRPEAERGEDVHLEIELRSFEAAEGTRHVVHYEALVRCTACMGHGMVALPDPECEFCEGTGRKLTVSNLDSAEILRVEVCPVCLSESCDRCGGAGIVPAEQRVRLLIPPGIEDEAWLRVKGDGNDAGAGSIPGDLLVQVHVQPPPRDPRVVRYAAFALLLVAIATLVLYVLT